MLLTSYGFRNKTLKIGDIMKGKPGVAYQKYVVNDFMTGRTVLRLDEAILQLMLSNYNRWFIKHL